MRVHNDWAQFMAEEKEQPYHRELVSYLARERASSTVYPSEELVYRALDLTPLREVKVVILGQDPYHGKGQAHGLAFSVGSHAARPPSLDNIIKELRDDIHPSGYLSLLRDLTPWAKRGVLLLNSALTVREGQAGSHQAVWRQFTRAALVAVVRSATVVPHFMLWGKEAKKLVEEAFQTSLHRPYPIEFPWMMVPENPEFEHSFTVHATAHPSPLSSKGFMGTKPFSRANLALKFRNPGRDGIEVDWSLP